MCLRVNYLKHPTDKNGYHKPRVANRDIVVYKVLRSMSGLSVRGKNVEAIKWTSPYRAKWQWKFAYLATEPLIRIKYANAGEAGLHSCRTKTAAKEHLNSEYWPDRKAFPAIIPKGSEVYFGLSGDIMSSKLIVYKDMAQLEAVHGKVGKGVKQVHIASLID